MMALLQRFTTLPAQHLKLWFKCALESGAQISKHTTKKTEDRKHRGLSAS